VLIGTIICCGVGYGTSMLTKPPELGASTANIGAAEL